MAGLKTTRISPMVCVFELPRARIWSATISSQRSPTRAPSGVAMPHGLQICGPSQAKTVTAPAGESTPRATASEDHGVSFGSSAMQ